MNIFYLHGVSSFGGSTKSLVELYTQLKSYAVKGTVLCPSGFSEQILSNIGMRTNKVIGLAQFDNTLYGYYRKLRWLILIREITFILPTLWGLIKIKFKHRSFDIIHANEITLLPAAIFAKILFRCPLVVHVRSVQRGGCKDLRTRLMFFLLKKYANSVISIDETVKASIPNYIHSVVVHNGINLPKQFKQLKPKSGDYMLRVGIVGSLLRLKGVYEFIDAARILIRERNLPVQFIIVGENARKSNGVMAWVYKKLGFSDNTMADILQFIKSHKLEESITVMGFVKDVRAIYKELDILCFPSYLNAAGRPVFEAALFGIPSIVAIKDPKPDAIIDHETGICIREKCSISLADAIEFLTKNPEERNRFGKNAQILALTQFNIKENAKKVMEIYKNQLDDTFVLQAVN